jgi:hypothetical protein
MACLAQLQFATQFGTDAAGMFCICPHAVRLLRVQSEKSVAVIVEAILFFK